MVNREIPAAFLSKPGGRKKMFTTVRICSGSTASTIRKRKKLEV